MILKDKICYSKLLWMQQQPDGYQAVHKVTYTSPNVEHEGMLGYVETEVTIDVKELSKLVSIMDRWHTLTVADRSYFYNLVRGITCVRPI